MNTFFAVVIGLVASYLGYNQYARRIDREVIQSDPKRMTPARLYTDGVDFVPTSRNVLFGYHFKSIAAAGPIVGAITAANLWGWLPAIIWLVLGVVFIGWVSDYTAIVVSIRNEGNSLSAIAHRLIAPRTRIILFIFIFFYLLLIGGAFGGILADVMNSQSQAPLGIIVLMLMGLLLGQMLYRWRVPLIAASLITVGVTFAAILLGPASAGFFKDGLDGAINAITGGQPVVQYFDPTVADPKTGLIVGADRQILPSFIFWALFILAFCYFGSVLPIWRWAQPVVYIGFWITATAMLLGLAGAALALFLKPDVAMLKLAAFKGWDTGVGGALQPIWPMLFVTIACGAISGWHALFGSVGTARQLEYETDALPVGGGSMFMEFLLGLLALLAVSVGGGGGAGAFANGLASFMNVFGIPLEYGRALAFAAFVVIVLVVTQLVFRIMRVTLAEWLGDAWPALRNIHVSTIVSLALAFFLVMTGTWIYLWQLFGGANQLMASLSLLVVTVWLVSIGRKAAWVGIPMLFMYVTTVAANLVTAYNLYVTVFVANVGQPGRIIPVIGSGLMIVVALLLVGAALVIGYDGWQAFRRYRAQPVVRAAAPAS
ncbi:MAG TPA: carbon starvation CstA family protein [Chloroflexota bacterium]|nr:carbon starvation CstA family protein [Chloroflexota bacterium]